MLDQKNLYTTKEETERWDSKHKGDRRKGWTVKERREIGTSPKRHMVMGDSAFLFLSLTIIW